MLEKTCRCSSHHGPCWLYRDYQTKLANLRWLELVVAHTAKLNELCREQRPETWLQAEQHSMGIVLSKSAYEWQETKRQWDRDENLRTCGLQTITYDDVLELPADALDPAAREMELRAQLHLLAEEAEARMAVGQATYEGELP